MRAANAKLGGDIAGVVLIRTPPLVPGLGKMTLRHFPFDLVALQGKSAFLVLAVAHHSRAPGYWRDRVFIEVGD